MGAYQSLMKRFGHTRAFRAMFKRTLPPIDRAINKLTGGKRTFGSTVVPTFVVIHTGRKTGKGTEVPVRARLALGAERDELWPRFVEMWPAYNTYDKRSGDRNIRLFVLECRTATGGARSATPSGI